MLPSIEYRLTFGNQYSVDGSRRCNCCDNCYYDQNKLRCYYNLPVALNLFFIPITVYAMGGQHTPGGMAGGGSTPNPNKIFPHNVYSKKFPMGRTIGVFGVTRPQDAKNFVEGATSTAGHQGCSRGSSSHPRRDAKSYTTI